MGTTLRTVVGLSTLLAAHYSAPAYADVTISSTTSTIQLKDGTAASHVILVFKVDGLKAKQEYPLPTAQSLSNDAGGPVLKIYGDPTVVAHLANGAFYQVNGTLENLPLSSTFETPVLIHLDKTDDLPAYAGVITYKFTNVLPPVDADVAPGSNTIFLSRSRDTQFTVNLKGRPLRGLAVCQSALADANTGARISEQDLGLYLDKGDFADNPQLGSKYLTLTAPSTAVHLHVKDAFEDKGVFMGTVALCSASKASVATLSLTVNSSTWEAKTVGAVLILVGIGIYLLVAVVLKQRTAQLTALLPASRLVGSLRELQATTRRVAHDAEVDLHTLLGDANVPHSLEGLIAQLSEKNLKSYLPSLFTNPFQPIGIGTEYQQLLQSISAQELNLAIIVNDGLVRVMSIRPKPDIHRMRDGLVKLDALATEAASPDPMRPKVDNIVNDIPPHIQDVEETAQDDNGSERSSVTPTVHEITFQLEYLSGLGWAVWGLISFMIGSSVLVLSNHGFGTWQDFAKCFLWGLGIQAAGQGLQALTPSTAATSFSLQIGH